MGTDAEEDQTPEGLNYTVNALVYLCEWSPKSIHYD